MVDSSVVLWGQALIYTLYVLACVTVVGTIAYQLTREGPPRVPPRLFYGFAALLVVTGLSLHLITHETIPWARTDVDHSGMVPDQTFEITAANHQFTLPSSKLEIACGQKVLINVTSEDLTYGFGLFRQDHSMVLQMQVIPGHRNEVFWTFDKNGVYDIRSTEYSGPAGLGMGVKNAVEVTGCPAS